MQIKKGALKKALGSDPDGIRTHIVRTGILNSIHWTTGPWHKGIKKIELCDKKWIIGKESTALFAGRIWLSTTLHSILDCRGVKTSIQIKKGNKWYFPEPGPTRSWPNSRKSVWHAAHRRRSNVCRRKIMRSANTVLSGGCWILYYAHWWLTRIGKWWFRNWRDAIWLCCITEGYGVFHPSGSIVFLKKCARWDYPGLEYGDCLSKS